MSSPAVSASLTAYREAVRTAIGPAAVAGPSPVHPFVLSTEAFEEITRQIGGTGVQVHISQEFTVHRLLRDGEAARTGIEVVGARKEARGVRLALRTEMHGAGGEPVCAMVTTVLLAGATSPESFGQMPPLAAPSGSGPGEPVTRTVSLTRPWIARYAEVSGDLNPIHLDDEAARAAGFDGVIAHGMSMVALVTELAADLFAGGDPARVRGLGCRFSAPVRPDEPVEVTFQPDAAGSLVTFTCATPRGIALKGGWVTLGAGDD